MVKRIIGDGYTIFVNNISTIRVVEATNNNTKNVEYLVIAMLADCIGIDFSDARVLVLSKPFADVETAKRFKDLLDFRMNASGVDTLYLEDIEEEFESQKEDK